MWIFNVFLMKVDFCFCLVLNEIWVKLRKYFEI